VSIKEGSFQGNSIQQASAKDIRYTRNKAGTVVYAIALGWPDSELELRSLGTSAATKPGRVQYIEYLGGQDRVKWTQTDTSLRIGPPRKRPDAASSAVAKIHLG
jgi:alpha-L-fucosidase